MKHLQAYDQFLKKLGENGTQKTGLAAVGLGPILLVTVPFLLATVMVSAIFETFVEKSPIGTTAYAIIGLALVFASFYSGFRVVHYRAQWLREK